MNSNNTNKDESKIMEIIFEISGYRYEGGEFKSAEEAIQAARNVANPDESDFLEELFKIKPIVSLIMEKKVTC